MVVFDVGETLVDETRHWSEWADWMGIPRFTFFAVFGAVVAAGWHHREVFTVLRPAFDLMDANTKREAEGWRYDIQESDFYADALPCLRALRVRYRLGIAGNQPLASETALAALKLGVDLIASSEGWGVAKPSQAFFSRLVAEAKLPATEIAYVGDTRRTTLRRRLRLD